MIPKIKYFFNDTVWDDNQRNLDFDIFLPIKLKARDREKTSKFSV